MWSSIVFSIFLIVVSAVLSAVQLRSWRAAGRRELNERDRRFLGRQFRRRIQIDVMIGVVGVAILGGLWITDPAAKIFPFFTATASTIESSESTETTFPLTRTMSAARTSPIRIKDKSPT